MLSETLFKLLAISVATAVIAADTERSTGAIAVTSGPPDIVDAEIGKSEIGTQSPCCDNHYTCTTTPTITTTITDYQ